MTDNRITFDRKSATAARREVADFFSAHYPDLWQSLLPRVYVSQGAFASARDLASTICSINASTKPNTGVAPTNGHTLLFADQAMRYNMPAFHVTKEFGRALSATRVPDSAIIHDLNWPFDAICFHLEENTLSLDESSDLFFVGICRVPAGTAISRPHFPPLYCAEDTVIVIGCERAGSLAAYSASRSWDQLRDNIRPDVIQNDVVSIDDAGAVHLVNDDQGAASVADATEKLFHFGINLLTALSSSPQYIQQGSRARAAKRASGDPELWTPNYLGKSFRPSTSALDNTSDSGGSVRPHWRRGHFHTVLSGKGRSVRSIRWFEPVFVSP